jgi:hypothetical protein
LPTWDTAPSIRHLLTRARAATGRYSRQRLDLGPPCAPLVRLSILAGVSGREHLPQRYVTKSAIRNRRDRRCRGHSASNKGRLNAVSQLRCPRKEREEWFSLEEDHEKVCRIGLNQSGNHRGHPCKQSAVGIGRYRTMRGCVGQDRALGFPLWCCWCAHLQLGRRANQCCPR